MHLMSRACSVARACTGWRLNPCTPGLQHPEKTSAPASLHLHRRHVTFWGIRERERDWEREHQAQGERAGGAKGR